MNYPIARTLSDTPQSEVRLTQVEEQTQRLETLAGDLEKVAAVLSQRLAGVTRVSDRNEKPEPTIPHPVLVPLAEKLNTIGDHINLAINAFRDLNDRIELPC